MSRELDSNLGKSLQDFQNLGFCCH